MFSSTIRKEIEARLQCKVVHILTIPIMHIDWEIDNYAWLVYRADNKQYELFTTNHGKLTSMTKDLLQSTADQYQNAINTTHAALDLLNKSGH